MSSNPEGQHVNTVAFITKKNPSRIVMVICRAADASELAFDLDLEQGKMLEAFVERIQRDIAAKMKPAEQA